MTDPRVERASSGDTPLLRGLFTLLFVLWVGLGIGWLLALVCYLTR